MSSFKSFLKAGHSPTLFAAFLYFSFSCSIWVLNGAMAPFITETYKLGPAEKGLMLSIPILAGALMRFHSVCWRSTSAARRRRWSKWG